MRQNTSRPQVNKPRNDTSGKKPIPLDQVECYNCHCPGHYSNNCPDRPRVFAAQVIDEDKESPSADGTEEQEQHSVPEESAVEDNEVPSDPQGSQYDSDQDEYPLDKYKEYIKVEGDEDEDADVVYIRTMRAIADKNLIEEIADTSSISDSVSTMVESTNTSVELTDIPSDMTPNELLLTLPKNIWIEIFMRRKVQEEPN